MMQMTALQLSRNISSVRERATLVSSCVGRMIRRPASLIEFTFEEEQEMLSILATLIKGEAVTNNAEDNTSPEAVRKDDNASTSENRTNTASSRSLDQTPSSSMDIVED